MNNTDLTPYKELLKRIRDLDKCVEDLFGDDAYILDPLTLKLSELEDIIYRIVGEDVLNKTQDTDS